MTPKQIAAARHKLGLTLEQLAMLLGIENEQRRKNMWQIENGYIPKNGTLRKLIRSQERLLQAYLDGYRPKDWPSVD